MTLFETHSHLNDKAFDADRGAVLAAAFASGVGKIVEIACAPADWAGGAALAAAYPGRIACAFGAHPEYSKALTAEELARLESHLGGSGSAAVGEIGVDYWWDCAGGKEQQLALLAAQLPLCAKFSRPAVFHARNGRAPEQNAYADLLGALKGWAYAPAGRRRGVLHCFSGTWADAKAGLDLGLLLGINGTFTYKNNQAVRDIALRAGLGNIVLETDCPYLPPQGARGKRNDPSFIPEIAAYAASCFGVSNAELAEKTTANAVELFGSF